MVSLDIVMNRGGRWRKGRDGTSKSDDARHRTLVGREERVTTDKT